MALRVRSLTWDSWNVPHIARHAVTPDEVEEVCHGPFVTLTGYAERILVLGPTAAGRMLVAGRAGGLLCDYGAPGQP